MTCSAKTDISYLKDTFRVQLQNQDALLDLCDSVRQAFYSSGANGIQEDMINHTAACIFGTLHINQVQQLPLSGCHPNRTMASPCMTKALLRFWRAVSFNVGPDAPPPFVEHFFAQGSIPLEQQKMR